MIDFELIQQMDIAEFKERLQVQLSETLPLYDVQVVDIKAPSATKALEQADYLLAITAPDDNHGISWQAWIDQLLAADEILDTHTTKSGKVKQINLRERLHSLEIVNSIPDNLPDSVIHKLKTTGDVVIRYVGSCRNDGNMLRPEQLARMLERQLPEGQTLLLGHVHRQRLIMA